MYHLKFTEISFWTKWQDLVEYRILYISCTVYTLNIKADSSEQALISFHTVCHTHSNFKHIIRKLIDLFKF